MRLLRVLLSLAVVAGLTGVAYVAQKVESAGTKMTVAAEKFLDTLKDDQKKKATFDFDDKERTNWNFIPLQDKSKKYTRKGLPMEEMTPEQKKAALGLVRAGTSSAGFEKAITIMSLEGILKELEGDKGAMVRNPEWYFVTIFGKPSADGKWGWRIEGHHLSLNLVVDKGQVSAVTPWFYGANPATVKDGPRKGLRTLPNPEDLAIDLFKSLDDDQKKVAFKEKHFGEPEQGKAAPSVGAAQGLPAKKMTDKQKETLVKLLADYTSRMPEPFGAEELAGVKKSGMDDVYFAFTGAPESGKPHTYRVQGPTFVVEFLNIQEDSAKNPANHIHSCWRRINGDFGLTTK
jgi:hypothetical protein